jgi:hypothetical protein
VVQSVLTESGGMHDLRLVGKEELRGELRGLAHFSYNEETDYLTEQASYLFRVRICDEIVFRNLMILTWVVKERESPRTLEAIVERANREYGGLDGLVAARLHHNRDWYARVREIHRVFRWSLVGPLFLVPVKGRRMRGRQDDSELGLSPAASLAIANGAHCSLAGMFRLADGSTPFEPVEAILVLPRIDYDR